jgi:type IX secretion system PorP/SprF family membrane protein
MKKLLRYLLMICPVAALGQDIHFSQFTNMPLNLNPGIAGFTDCDYRIYTNYKRQWASVAPFSTKYVSYDMSAYELANGNSLGAGVSFFNDKAGTAAMGLTNINLAVSYAFRVSKKGVISPGISAAYNQRSISIGGLRWDNQYDGTAVNTSLPSGENGAAPYHYFDYAGGAMYKQKLNKEDELQAGFSALHLNMPRYSFGGTGDRLSIRYVVNANYQKQIADKSYIVPSALLMKQGAAMEITAGAMYKVILGMDSKYTNENVSSYMMIGGFYRVKDALIFSFYYDYKHKAALGLSYDINLSGLTSATTGRGGPEVSLVYKGFLSERSASRKTSVRFN